MVRVGHIRILEVSAFGFGNVVTDIHALIKVWDKKQVQLGRLVFGLVGFSDDQFLFSCLSVKSFAILLRRFDMSLSAWRFF